MFFCKFDEIFNTMNQSQKDKILLAPLQGLTDFRFRNAFNSFFSGIDTFYSPWICLSHSKEIKKSHSIDVKPENNIGYRIIPQIMTNDAEDFIYLANYLSELGHKEMNWNLGCPYPMVAKKGMGSGMLCQPLKIVELLENVLPKIDIKLSIKMRLGYDNNTETSDLIPHLNNLPLSEIIIHGRTAKQLYTGSVDQDAFQNCVSKSTQSMVYNGDITTVSELNLLREKFPTIKKWMIGRGIIANPFLPEMIQNNSDDFNDNSAEVFMKFHDVLMDNYAQQLSGDKHLLMKMESFWEYFSKSFSDSNTIFKRVKKSKNISMYHDAVARNLSDGFGK